MKVIKFFLILNLCILSLDVFAMEPTTLTYKSLETGDLSLDIYSSATGDVLPVIFYIHGGAWRAGDKSVGSRIADIVMPMGYAVVAADFRSTLVAPYPANLEDLKDALNFVEGISQDYGLDSERLVVMGESSGAHLALLIGLTTSRAVRGIAAYFPASNLTTILQQSTPFGLEVRRPALQKLLGGLPEEVPELAKAASPVFHVGSKSPPLLLMHGDQDPQMPINQSLEMLGKYEELGLSVTFVPVHGAAHGGSIFFREQYLQALDDFLYSTLNRSL